MISLFNETTLTITRDDGDGYYDDSGQWSEGSVSTFDVIGSLQPYREGSAQRTLPEGLKSYDSQVYFTQSLLRTVNEFGETKADTAVIDSLTYVALFAKNYSRSGLIPSHYEVVFVKQDKLTNGGL